MQWFVGSNEAPRAMGEGPQQTRGPARVVPRVGLCGLRPPPGCDSRRPKLGAAHRALSPATTHSVCSAGFRENFQSETRSLEPRGTKNHGDGVYLTLVRVCVLCVFFAGKSVCAPRNLYSRKSFRGKGAGEPGPLSSAGGNGKRQNHLGKWFDPL